MKHHEPSMVRGVSGLSIPPLSLHLKRQRRILRLLVYFVVIRDVIPRFPVFKLIARATTLTKTVGQSKTLWAPNLLIDQYK